MNLKKYKILFYVSLVCNIILVALLFKPLPKEEQELVDFFRDVKENQSSILPEEKSEEVKKRSQKIIEDISQDWDVNTLKKHFSSSVLDQIGEEKLPKIVRVFRRLGKFETKLLPESIETVPGQPGVMLYSTNARFENGDGYVRLVLEKIDNDWYLNRININSEVFLK